MRGSLSACGFSTNRDEKNRPAPNRNTRPDRAIPIAGAIRAAGSVPGPVSGKSMPSNTPEKSMIPPAANITIVPNTRNVRYPPPRARSCRYIERCNAFGGSSSILSCASSTAPVFSTIVRNVWCFSASRFDLNQPIMMITAAAATQNAATSITDLPGSKTRAVNAAHNARLTIRDAVFSGTDAADLAAAARSGAQNREPRGGNLAEQRDQPVGEPAQVLRAPLRVGAGRVAAGARRVQVLAQPADAHRLLRAEQRVAGGELVRQAFEVLELGLAHEVGPQVQHQRRLDLAPVDVVHGFARVEQPRRRAEREVAGACNQHAVVGAQAQRDQVHERLLAAVRVEDHELAHPRARNAGADVAPGVRQRLAGDAQRAGEAPVLGARAHGERG